MVAEVFAGRARTPRTCPLVDEPVRVRGGDLLHLLLQPGLEPGGRVAGLARHRRRDDEAGARDPAARRAPAAGQPAPVGARQTPRGRPPRRCACWPGRGRTARSGSSTSPTPTGRTRGSSPATASASRASWPTSVIPEQVRKAIVTGETVDRDRPGGPAAGAVQRRGEPDRRCRRPHRRRPAPGAVAGRDQPIGALVLGTSPHLPLDDDYRIFLDAGRRAGRRRRRGRAGGRGRAPPRRASAPSSTPPGPSSSPTSRSPCSAPSSAPRSLPGRLRRPLRAGHRHAWRSAATGTTSSTCRTAGTASSWATSSAADWPRRR